MEKERLHFEFKFILWAAIFIQLVLAGILLVQLAVMNIAPIGYLVGYTIAILLLNVCVFFSAKKKWLGIIMLIISLIVSAVLIYGMVVLKKVDNTVKEVTKGADEKVTEIVILVLKDSEAEEVTDLSQFSIAYMNDSDYEATSQTMDEIKKTVGDINFVEFSDATSMVDALYARTIPAILMNRAYIDVIDELEDYGTFSEDTKIIYSNEIISYINLVSEHDSNLDTFVIYFSGIDTYGGVSATSRSDVNILAVVNTKTKHIQLINTPRDYYVALPNSGGVKDKLTHAGLYGVDNSIGALEMLYDVDVDYYVRMNFSGFENIIDALGGIDVYSEYDFTVEPIKHYTVGVNHLSGIEALAFARERHSFASGDIQRGKNQMAVITAMIQKLSSSQILYNYTDVLDSISESFQTNMTSDEIYALVKMQLSDMSGWNIESYTVTGSNGSSTTFSMPKSKAYVMIPSDADVAAAKEKIQAVLEE